MEEDAEQPKEEEGPSVVEPKGEFFEVQDFEKPVSPPEIERPSISKIEEMLTELSEKEISPPKGAVKEEEEEEEEELEEVGREEDEEILVKKSKKKMVSTRPTRFIRFAILGCILGGILGGGFYFGKNYYESAINLININLVNKLFKPSADLIVSSNPVGCDLFVDDIVKGKTPITIKKLPAGDHNIRLEKEGFKPFISIINVSSRKPINIIANLEPEIKEIKMEEAMPVETATLATLIVRTSPKDSRVYIDGKLVRMPYSLLPGTYSIKVERDGFFKFKKIIAIKQGETKEVFVKLQPLLGSIFIDSIPRGGDVVFDGSFRGKTPLILTNISPWKPFKITITKGGYFNWHGTTFVEPRERTKIMAFMRKKVEQEPFSLEKAMFVPKEPFYKTEKTETSDLTRAIDRFKEGVEVSFPEFPEIPKEKPIPHIGGGGGRCFITSIPPGAEIFLDGKFIGKTPIRDFIISGGHHQLKASLSGFKDQEKEVIINQEEANFFNFFLKK